MIFFITHVYKNTRIIWKVRVQPILNNSHDVLKTTMKTVVEDREISICVWMIIEILIGVYTREDGKLMIIQTYLEI